MKYYYGISLSTFNADRSTTRLQQNFLESKSNSSSPNLTHASIWQMGHNSQPYLFCGREVLLASIAWLSCRRSPSLQSVSAISEQQHTSFLWNVLVTYGFPDLMMSFHHQTSANMCQISQNNWKYADYMQKVSFQLVSSKTWRCFARQSDTNISYVTMFDKQVHSQISFFERLRAY